MTTLCIPDIQPTLATTTTDKTAFLSPGSQQTSSRLTSLLQTALLTARSTKIVDLGRSYSRLIYRPLAKPSACLGHYYLFMWLGSCRPLWKLNNKCNATCKVQLLYLEMFQVGLGSTLAQLYRAYIDINDDHSKLIFGIEIWKHRHAPPITRLRWRHPHIPAID